MLLTENFATVLFLLSGPSGPGEYASLFDIRHFGAQCYRRERELVCNTGSRIAVTSRYYWKPLPMYMYV